MTCFCLREEGVLFPDRNVVVVVVEEEEEEEEEPEELEEEPEEEEEESSFVCFKFSEAGDPLSDVHGTNAFNEGETPFIFKYSIAIEFVDK